MRIVLSMHPETLMTARDAVDGSLHRHCALPDACKRVSMPCVHWQCPTNCTWPSAAVKGRGVRYRTSAATSGSVAKRALRATSPHPRRDASREPTMSSKSPAPGVPQRSLDTRNQRTRPRRPGGKRTQTERCRLFALERRLLPQQRKISEAGAGGGLIAHAEVDIGGAHVLLSAANTSRKLRLARASERKPP